MICTLYFGTFLASLLILISILVRHRRISTNIMMFSILITINSLGRFLLSTSSTLELAILANTLLYIGGCFCPLLLTMILAEYGQVNLPKWLSLSLTCFSILVFALSLSVGHSSFYYRSMDLVRTQSFTYLAKQYGPIHFLSPLMGLCYFLTSWYVLIRCFQHRKRISFRLVSQFVVLLALILGANILEQVLHNYVSFVSLGYFLALLLLVHQVTQFDKFDLATNIATSLEALNEIAYLEFNDHHRCMGYNQQAKDLFPEIEDTCPIDCQPVANDSPLYTQVISWFLTHQPGDRGDITLGDRHYVMGIRSIPYRNKPCVGYMLELVDRTAEQRWALSMQNYNEQLKTDVAQATAHVSHIKDMLVVGMASMVESRDDSTGGHVKRTYQVMRTFSEHLLPYREQLGITTEFLDMVTRAAPMHDLGKIAIRDSVLKKEGRFTPEDFEIMKRHPEEGARIVRHILTGVEDPAFVRVAENVAHYHHERWDGSGYPEGLKADQIPLEARLMALPDVCDAMLSKRCYKDPLSYDQVFSFIEESLGTHFDPVFGKYFIQCRREIERMYELWYCEDRDRKLLELKPSLDASEAQAPQ